MTTRRTPDFDLYGFKPDLNESQRELLEGLADGRLPKDEFYIGGRIVREHPELKELLENKSDSPQPATSEANPESKLKGIRVFSTSEAAIEALIKDASLEVEG